MKKTTLKMSFWAFALFLCTYSSIAQVGIGTITPASSSILDLTANDKGFLTPRMTTTERLAIALPVDGLIVYDTTLKFFFHYNTTTSSWLRITSEANGRSNFKRIKSTDVLATVLAAEKTAGGNTKYLLNANTYYEINGTIAVDLPIELNNAYLVGLDANDDVLSRSGNLFTGSTGGTVKNLTIVVPSGLVFSISGGNTESLIVRDCIIANSANVGSISGLGLVFFAVINYSANTTGIVYNNITRLLLSNTAWFGNNAGTFERFTGTFSLIQKQGGFCEVNGTAIGVDVSSNPVINGDAVMETVVFTGTLSTGMYVKGYSPSVYAGYNFNNKWAVICSGIPLEGDRFSSSNFYLDRTQTLPSIAFSTAGIAYKLPGATIGTNLFRMSDGGVSNRIVYNGQKTRTFTVTSSVSMQVGGSGVSDFLFFFVKYTAAGVGSIVTSSETFIDSNSGFIQSFPISGTVQLSAGDYVELHGARLNGSNKTLVFNSYNMSVR
jgi:hypothetical protein